MPRDSILDFILSHFWNPLASVKIANNAIIVPGNFLKPKGRIGMLLGDVLLRSLLSGDVGWEATLSLLGAWQSCRTKVGKGSLPESHDLKSS